MTNSEISELITQSESEIGTLQSQLNYLQERQNLLKTAEVTKESILLQLERAIKMLNQISPNQVAIFKSEIDEKFEAVEWRSNWDADKIGEVVLHEPRLVEVPVSNAPKSNKKSDKALVTIFGERVKQYRQFLIIREELWAIGVDLGQLITNQDNIKAWQLSWLGDKAGLFWTSGAGWSVEVLKPGDELTGQWEDFDLDRQLIDNDVDLDSEDEDSENEELVA